MTMYNEDEVLFVRTMNSYVFPPFPRFYLGARIGWRVQLLNGSCHIAS